MNKTKQIFNWLAVILVAGVIIFGITWVSMNWNNLTSGSKLYTESERNDYGDERYQAGLEQAEEYKILVLEYKKQLNEFENNINGLTILLEKEKSKNKQNETLISTLESSIETFKSQITSLQNEVTRLTGLIESYEDISAGTHEVNFYIGDILFKTKAVRFNTTISETTTPPESNQYRFDGWSTDRVSIVDINEFVITENTNFYAITTQKFQVEFISSDNIYLTQYVVRNEKPEKVSNPTQEFYMFKGWELNGTIVNPFEMAITESTTFNAKFEEVYEWVDIPRNGEALNFMINSTDKRVKEGFENFTSSPYEKIRIILSEIQIISNGFSWVDSNMNLTSTRTSCGFVIEENEKFIINLENGEIEISFVWNENEKQFELHYLSKNGQYQALLIGIEKVEVYKLKQ